MIRKRRIAYVILAGAVIAGVSIPPLGGAILIFSGAAAVVWAIHQVFDP